MITGSPRLISIARDLPKRGAVIGLTLVARRVGVQAPKAQHLLALFRTSLEKCLGQDDGSGELSPFGDDVSDDLSPFGIGVHFGEKNDPGDTRYDEEDGERMLQDIAEKAIHGLAKDCLALGRAFFIENFRCQNGNQQPSPIGDGIAEERSPMGLFIGNDVEHCPPDQDEDSY